MGHTCNIVSSLILRIIPITETYRNSVYILQWCNTQCLETLTGHWVVVSNIVSSLILRIIPIMKHTEILYIYYHGVIHMCLETLTGHGS